jgi:hypothetical protein
MRKKVEICEECVNETLGDARELAKQEIQNEVSTRAALNFIGDVRKYATKAVAAFVADMIDCQDLTDVEALLHRAGLWDAVVDTYQQRSNRRFTRRAKS